MPKLLDKLKNWVVNNPTIVGLLESTQFTHRKVNGIAINSLVGYCRYRPHPWSTIHDYTSWDALTKSEWSARHLPAVNRNHPRSPQELSAFFNAGENQQLSDKSTTLFPAFAQHLTDGFIRTRMQRQDEDSSLRLQNTSNHNIDLSPLYGRTMEQTEALRLRSNDLARRGRLKSEVIEDEEWAPFLYRAPGEYSYPEFNVLDAPLGQHLIEQSQVKLLSLFAFGGDRANASPAVSMINTLFLREHNRLAGEISCHEPTWDDERVFQTTRNALIVAYIKIVVEEYINHISPTRFRLLADPEVAWTADWNRPNWITAEFSLLYRWHPLVPGTLDWNNKQIPVQDTFLNNQPLLDIGLTQAIYDTSAQRAGQIGAFNTVPALVPFEQSAIAQDHLVRLAPYNDYREYASLDRLIGFEEISSNPRVVEFLSTHYDSIDDVDFYVGLFAEDRKLNSPLPDLMARLVAVDAFSQALTNPLLSRTVFREETFSEAGWDMINSTGDVRSILARNSDAQLDQFVGMTQPNWRPAS